MTPGPDPSSSPSMHTISPPGKCPVTGGRDGGAPHHQGPLLLPPYMSVNPRNSMSITNTKGLLNMPGQNNCFLNSAVQVLWHLDIFRRSFRELNGHACMAESCIFCALKELFAQFQYSQESALPPDALRRALAETFCDQRRFQLGFMDDAAECFENILLRIHFHIANKESEDMCSASHCIPHQKFAMTLVEQTVCHACGATSEPLPFTQMVHYVPSSALCSQAKVLRNEKGDVRGFGELLKRAGGLGDLRDCPSSCGTVIQIRKTLMNKPEIVSIGLVWDSERPTIDHIMDVFSTIGMTLKLQDVFHSVVDSRWAASATHQLVGIVTYYGKHYSTFFFHTKLRVWIYFDDAAVREIGPKWEQVVEKCYRGHFQPLLLLYANPYGTSISTSTAPHDVTVVSTHKKSFIGKDANGIKASEKIRKSQSTENQRRAMTPNPEASCDVNANILPRRAVTPSGEIIHSHETNGKNTNKSRTFEQEKRGTLFGISPSTNTPSGTDANSDHVYSVSNYLAYKHELWRNKCMSNSLESSGKKCHMEEKVGCVADQCWSFLSHSPAKGNSGTDSDIIIDRTKEGRKSSPVPASTPDDIVNVANSCRITSPNRFAIQGICSKEVSDHSAVYEEDRTSEKTYISRKTVENVLHLQNLQRQKSVNAKHSHACVSQRNSNSSLESLENIYFVQDKGVDNFLGLKLDIPESINVPRKRDSGNWSGDRNSASSSSTTSLDNPYFYSGNKRSFCSGRNTRTSIPDSTTSTDPGYDSFSLSSSDSYPSVIAFSPGKVDPRLGLILENSPSAFIPHMSQLQHCVHDISKSEESHSYGFRDECEKLCIEADIFLAKSVERENIGDISMAALLSDSAAAKARAAMDVPYSNPHSLSLAKLKHSTCIIRSCNLHKKLKEAVALEQQRREHIYKPHQNYEPSHEFKITELIPPRNSNNSERQGHANIKDFHSPIMPQKCSESHGNADKAIEIYATLPKKSLRKKNGLITFMESLTGEDNTLEKTLKQKPVEVKLLGDGDTSFQSDASISHSTQSSAAQMKNNNTEICAKFVNSKKKSFIFAKSSKDAELSDSNEWEHPQKNSLHRTYSGPPMHDKTAMGESLEDNQSISVHTSKKQHKIRRKLMGGFMRRKNRSLPDLREGQDQTNGLSRSFDDCAITQASSPIKSLSDVNSREMHSSSLHIKNVHMLNKLSSEGLVTSSVPVLSQQKDASVKYTQNFNPVNTCSPMNQSFRAHTPPPYKPPPPITGSEFDSHHKRMPSHNKETFNKSASPVIGLETTTACSKTFLGESLKKQQHFVSKTGNKTQNDVGCTVSTSVLSSVTNKQSSVVNHVGSSKELPKGSAIWLKELQLKQEEIIQKRKQQEEKLKQQKHPSESSSSILCLSANEPNKCDGKRNDYVPKSFAVNCDQENSANESTNQGNSSESSQSSLIQENDQLSSVKYLALKFENIIKPSSEGIDPNMSHTGETGTHSQGLNKNTTLPNNDAKISATTSLSLESGDKISYHDSLPLCDFSPVGQQEKETATKFSPLCSTGTATYSSHLTDGQLTNMLHIGANRTAFRSGSVKIFNSKEIPCTNSISPNHKDKTACPETRRPDKPPDYETAIQRLELIRGDRNLLKHIDLNNIPGLDVSVFEHDKKKTHGPKKSVTFSDKVVLVACAGDEDNDFLPNPLLERVYKQHLMQKPSVDSSEKETTQYAHCIPENNSQCSSTSVELPKHMLKDSTRIPCNLCHSKLVLFPSIYCPDCAFYMSRFQK